MAASSYWKDTRAPRYSFVLALPLLLAYEALATALSGPASGVRNGADVILQALVGTVVGAQGIVYVTGLVMLLCVAWVVRDVRRNGAPIVRRFPLMLLESACLAVVFAIVVGVATAQLLAGLDVALTTLGGAEVAGPPRLDRPTALMLSLGAGLYEELLFRVLLVSAIAAGMRTLLGAGTATAAGTAAVVSAIIFSAFHYIGDLGDPFTVESFAFRAIAGLAFSGLYVLRGFGITAWTHALYDVGVLVL